MARERIPKAGSARKESRAKLGSADSVEADSIRMLGKALASRATGHMIRRYK